MEQINFKKEVKKYIRKEIVPILKANGFQKVKDMTYIREMNGLLQRFYFCVKKFNLEPWFYFLPVFEASGVIASLGSNHIYVHDVLSPYLGYGEVYREIDSNEYIPEEEYINKILPKLEKLKYCIETAIIPDMDKQDSLDKFIQCLLRAEKILEFDWSKEHYFLENVLPIYQSKGITRMQHILKPYETWKGTYPKEICTFVENERNAIDNDEMADQLFEQYCNLVRKANKIV